MMYFSTSDKLTRIKKKIEHYVRRLEAAEADCGEYEVKASETKESLSLSERIDKPRMR